MFHPVGSLIYHNILFVKLFYNEAGTDTVNCFEGELIPELSVMGKAKANAGLLARRPDNLAFKHQRLPVWSPMLTAHTVLPSFYCMATIPVKLGVCLLATVQNTHELKVDYTHAGSCDKCFETTSC
ncbi:transmembrane protein 30C [Oncorhynchus clarkii lewisi]|uniref:transmembrane protein 30C n=1 Tax=Oncorhynchus clarkii lewisi TaxID=490388 RepID=UPI0039B86DC3